MATSTTGERADELAGLSLGDAFIRFVLQDSAVVEVSQRLLARKPTYASIFSEGVVPGPTVSFHWHLKCSAEAIAADFGRPLFSMLDDPMHQPSDLERAVSVPIAAAIVRFRGILASGAISAVGTFVGTGAEVAVGIGQWMRKDLTIDVENSAICDGTFQPIWTGVWLPTAQSMATGANLAKTREQIQTKKTSRDKCEDWLLSIVSDPDFEPLPKDDLWEIAKTKWPKTIGKLQFNACRNSVLPKLSEEQQAMWTRSGPRRKRS